MTADLKRAETHMKNAMWQKQRRKWQISKAKEHQGMLPTPEAKREHGIHSPWSLQRRHGCVYILIPNFWPLELWKSKIMLHYATQFVVLCWGSPRELIQVLTASAQSIHFLDHGRQSMVLEMPKQQHLPYRGCVFIRIETVYSHTGRFKNEAEWGRMRQQLPWWPGIGKLCWIKVPRAPTTIKYY